MLTQRSPVVTRADPPGGLPRAWPPALACLAVAAVAAVAGREGALPGRSAELVATAALASAPAVLVWLRAVRARTAAGVDIWIAHGRAGAPLPGALLQRSAELAGQPHRRRLARSLIRIVDDAAGPGRISARAPVDRSAVLAHRTELIRLAAVLAGPAPPARVRGVVLAGELVGSGASPVYGCDPANPGALGEALRQALFELLQQV